MTGGHRPPLIQLDGIGKTYRSGPVATEVLKGVTLSIEAGEFVAILGPSGSGKSTLMNIIGCLDRPSSGRYLVDGRDVSELDADGLAELRCRSFGFVFQQYNLLPAATAAENVEMPAIYAGRPRADRGRHARALLQRLGLGDHLRHLPGQMSGGQQQRVSIARALMNGGRVILADEPTGALDSASGREVIALLHELNAEGHTVIVITHDPDIAAEAHRRIRIADGRIVGDERTDFPRRPRAEARPSQAGRVRASAAANLAEIVRVAFASMRANLFRTVLTLLGVVIGVASVIAMLAIGDGAKREVIQQIEAMGTDLLLVRPGGPNQRGRGDVTTLVLEDANWVAQTPGIASVVPEREGNATLRAGNRDHRTQISATTENFPQARNWPVERGVFFAAEDVRQYAPVVLLGQTAAGALFAPGEDPVGRYILIRNVPFQVIGVMAAKGATSWGRDQDDVAFVPITTGSLRLFGTRHLSSVIVQVADSAQMKETQVRIEELLRARHGTEDFRVRNMASLLETATQTQDTFTLLLGSIAAISLLVGGIGVMNIMLVSVAERTREIGIRMATGARSGTIQLQFIVEALVVCCTGGLIGIGVGLAAAWLVTWFGHPTLVSLPPILLAFGCAAGTGLLFGYLPARKASRLDPVLALAAK
jgi:macrolide transport system ATP-binding/permease protein